MVYYLKVNRNCDYSIRNLQHWIDIIQNDSEAEIYIICDNDKLKHNILNNVKISSSKIYFITSIKCDETRNIVENTCIEKWYNAGYAHLTTFFHARQNKITEFWNIDADDTFICLLPQRAMNLLKKVTNYAQNNGINLFSLDMWTTVVENVYGTFHWTFGITYTNADFDWFDIMNSHCYDEKLKKMPLIDNLDKFFTYLALNKKNKIETFYINKLKFIHYSDDLFYRFEGSGFYYWNNKKLILPILYNCIGAKKRGKLKISKKVIKIEDNITWKEQMIFMNDFAYDKFNILKERKFAKY